MDPFLRPSSRRLTGGQSTAVFALVAAVLNSIFFRGLGPQEFIFSGDQFFRFGGHETFINSFFLRKPIDLGVLNGWQFATQLWDTLYYLVAYCVGLTPQLSEKILFFLVLFSSMQLSFLGFNEIAPRFGVAAGSPRVHAVVFWYCFNPYTLELWHGGVYNLGSGLTYSLAPLIFHYFSKTLFSPTDKARFLLCALLLAAASYTFWLLAPLVLFLAMYAILRVALQSGSWRVAAKNALLLSLAYLPLVSFLLFGILHEYFSNAGDNNSSFVPTFGNMQGGILYQLMMLFSWGIYTVWTPRTLYPFGDYFFSPAYRTGIILIYLAVVVGLVMYFAEAWERSRRSSGHAVGPIRRVACGWAAGLKRIGILGTPAYGDALATRQAISLVAIFALSVFLAKGAQPPWGNLFLYLYNHVPFFSVFRTPDIRFGFTIVFTLALLLLFVAQCYRRNFFVFGVFVIAALQARPFFSGSAVRGIDRPNLYYDRIVHIPKTYADVAAFINQHEAGGAYVLPIPAIEYGNYVIEPGEHFVGQDMVAKIVKAPFVYVSPSGGMAVRTYNLLKTIVETQQFGRLRDFPIRYVLLRKDICPECPPVSAERLAAVADMVYSDPVFNLYEMREYRSMIDSPDVTYERVSPVKYRVSFRHVRGPQKLRLLQNFNANWKLFAVANPQPLDCRRVAKNESSLTAECLREDSLLQADDWRYLLGPAMFESTHQLELGYANGWLISAAEMRANLSSAYYSTNADGSLDFTLTAYYRPEAGYLLAAFFSLVAGVMAFAWALFHLPARRAAGEPDSRPKK